MMEIFIFSRTPSQAELFCTFLHESDYYLTTLFDIFDTYLKNVDIDKLAINSFEYQLFVYYSHIYIYVYDI